MTFPAVILVLWLAFLAYWLVSAVGAKKNVNKQWKGVAIRMFIAVATLVCLRLRGVHIRMAQPPVVPVALGALGLAICLFGIGLAIWARRHLGRNWGMPMSIKAEPELVDTGPYAHIRHPIYTGILIAMLGSALAAGWWWGVFCVVFGLYFIYSAKTEEKRLSALMPTQYPAYMQRTRMLIPGVY